MAADGTKPISGLNELTLIAPDDLFAVVDTSEADPSLKTKNVTYQNLHTSVNNVYMVSASFAASITIPVNTETDIIFNNAPYFTGGGAYNLTTGVFTAPVSGFYCFDAYIRYSALTSSDDLFININTSLGPRPIYGQRASPTNLVAGANLIVARTSIVYLTVGITAKITVLKLNGVDSIYAQSGDLNIHLIYEAEV